MVPVIVGVPVGLNPLVPHSISQVVALPPSVQPKLALVAVIEVAVSEVGAGHIVEKEYGPVHELKFPPPQLALT